MEGELHSKTILDPLRNRGVDLTMRGDKIIHVDILEPADWGDYEWELMN